MKYHEALANALHQQKVTEMFGVVGDANLFFVEAWARTGGRYVAVAHEGSSVLAASGYAATSGRVGVATVTHGPALTNTLTALVDAVRARMPIVLIAGDTTPGVRGHLQHIDQRSVVEASGALFDPATTPQNVAEDLARAMRLATAKSRPVVLNIPISFQWKDVDYVPAVPGSVTNATISADPAAVEAAVGVIATARRPIVLGGRGAGGARKELVALAERIGAPVTTSLRGKGLFDGHPHDLGICGTLAHEVALRTIDSADCVIAFGAGLNDFTTANGSLMRGKRIVHVDLDRSRHDMWTTATVGIVGDAGEVAGSLVQLLDAAEVPTTTFADGALAEDLRAPRPTSRNQHGKLDVVAALRRLDRGFPAERTLVIDDGRFILTAYAELGAPHPSAYVHACSFASIGLAMGHALGAYEGARHRPVLMVAGDGGFMSAGLTELNTAVRAGSDVVIVLINDKAYGAEHVQLVNRGLDPTISTFDWPDFAPVADALGAQGVTVRTDDDLEKAFEVIATRTGPVLVDIQVDPFDVPGAFG